jgi:hypothetical protein
MVKNINFYSIVVICLLSSCGFDEEDFTPRPPKQPTYHQFSTEELDWLDLKGTWVYRDSLLGRTDTIFGNSTIRKRLAHTLEDAIGIRYTAFYYDAVYCEFKNTYRLNDDSIMYLSMRSKQSSSYFHLEHGISYGSGFLRSRIFNFQDNLMSINGFSNVLKSKKHSRWDDRTFYLAKGIGIVRVEYNKNDSINTITLIDHF